MSPIDKTVNPIPVQQLTELVNELASLAFFPSEDDARGAIAEDIADICPNLNEARWLVKRFRQLFNRWPGPRELRAVYCSRYKPRDGVEMASTEFPDGVPTPIAGSELAWYGAIAAAETKALPPGHVATHDALLDADVRMLVQLKDLNRPRRLKAAPEPTNPNYKPITAADIERAVEENRNRKAEGELSA